MLQLGSAARQLGLNPQTLYFYERIGLIPPPQRTEAGYRLYSQADLDRLAFISRLKEIGLSLEEIKEILALKQSRTLTCQAVRDRLQAKLDSIATKIQRLQALQAELTPLLELCQARMAQTDSTHQCQVLDVSSLQEFSLSRGIPPHPSA